MYFGWLQGFGKTSSFQIHMLIVLIIILLIQKCYYFHVNWYFLIIYILTQRKKCYRVLEYNHLCSSSALQRFLLYYGSVVSSKNQ